MGAAERARRARRVVEEAALREVKEEAGIVAEIVAPLEVLHYTKGNETVRVAFFLMRALGRRPSSERRRRRWLPAASAASRLAFANARWLLERAESARDRLTPRWTRHAWRIGLLVACVLLAALVLRA